MTLTNTPLLDQFTTMQTCDVAEAEAEEEGGGGVLGSFSLSDFSISLLPIFTFTKLSNKRMKLHAAHKLKNLQNSPNQMSRSSRKWVEISPTDKTQKLKKVTFLSQDARKELAFKLPGGANKRR